MKTAFLNSFKQPGGWSGSELAVGSKKKFNWLLALFGFYLLFVYPFYAYGMGYGLRLIGLWVSPLVLLPIGAPIVRWLFQDVPPKTACLWPRNAQREFIREYQVTLISVTAVWTISIVAFLQCIEFMQYGLGDQWNPFTREIRLTKGGPYDGYGVVQLWMFASGFFAISGMIWWPMYAFFEWLTMTKRTQLEGAAEHA
jgi:hypothetical protein